MKAKLLFLLALCFFATSVAFGQKRIVKGTVLSASDGEPMIGVSVAEKGTTNGAITDADGNFSISINEGGILVVSYVGYTPQQVKPVGSVPIKINLVEDSQMLDDVVVVGYGTMKKSDISGSVATINKEQMDRKIPTNVAQALQGAAAGVMVTAQDGGPGSKAAIRIRGVGTINGDAQPLYVVDGVQVGNNADFVNPQDIASIEVLKDASATAIYGSAGANGVIMITTKHGDKGKMNVNITADWGFQTLPYEIETLTGDAYAKSIREARANDGALPTNAIFDASYDGKRNNINWQDQMTRMGLRQQYGISASGGTDKTQYNFSVGYLDNKGIIVNTHYDRVTARASVKSKVNKYIEFGGDVNYMYTTAIGNNIGVGNNANLSSHRDIAQMAPTMDYIDDNAVGGKYVRVNVVNPDGTYGTSVAASPNGWDGMNQTAQNPYALQKEISRETRNARIAINPYADITLLKTKEHSLNLHSIFSWTQTNSDQDEFSGNYERYNLIDGEMKQIEYIGRGAGIYSFGLSQSKGLSRGVETYLTYKWESDFNTLTAMVGNSVSKYEGSWVSASTSGFLSKDHRAISLSENAKTGNGAFNPDVRTISYYGRLIYSLMDKYIVTATIRKDGSSNFSDSNRWATFPSAALAWRVKEESFLKDVDQVSNAKVRFGWGQTGNAGGVAGKGVYVLSTVDTKYQFYKDGIGGGATGAFDRVIGSYFPLVDTNLKWETNEQTNLGIDLGFLDNDLTVTADYFVRKTKDLLLFKQVRPSAGNVDVYTNYGEIDNRGFEFSINYNKRLNNDWTINVAFNGSTLKNEVKKMGVDYTATCSGGNSTYSADEIDGSNMGAIDGNGFQWNNHAICREGEAVGSYFGWKVDKIIQNEDEKNKARSMGQNDAEIGDYMFKDINKDGTIDDNDRTILGNGIPKFNYGLNLSATWRNIDMSIYTYGVLGMDILSYSAMRYAIINPSDDSWTPALLKESYENCWTPKNTGAKYARLTRLDNNKNARVSDVWVENGNFFKISNIQVGYTVPKKFLKPIGVSSARAYVAIQNLALFSPYKKYGDPEVGQGSVMYSGLDTGRYPTPRTYQCGLSVTF